GVCRYTIKWERYCGHSVNTPTRDESPSSTRVDHVYEQLRANIILGRHRPGSPLRLHELVEEYGVSLIPIREALRRLEVERLVESLPDRARAWQRRQPRRSRTPTRPAGSSSRKPSVRRGISSTTRSSSGQRRCSCRCSTPSAPATCAGVPSATAGS